MGLNQVRVSGWGAHRSTVIKGVAVVCLRAVANVGMTGLEPYPLNPKPETLLGPKSINPKPFVGGQDNEQEY